VQAEYGREVEATFGVASRWNPANKNAAQKLPYTQDELDVINAQWEWLKESSNAMGGYYTSRYLLTALNQTVIQGLSGRIALEDAVKEINKEMRRKQNEFGIPEDGSILYAERVDE
jgi:ABC-type glycerol-3-phosphate transport system substrate-binding protein